MGDVKRKKVYAPSKVWLVDKGTVCLKHRNLAILSQFQPFYNVKHTTFSFQTKLGCDGSKLLLDTNP